jgi:hypothetical protein
MWDAYCLQDLGVIVRNAIGAEARATSLTKYMITTPDQSRFSPLLHFQSIAFIRSSQRQLGKCCCQ